MRNHFKHKLCWIFSGILGVCVLFQVVPTEIFLGEKPIQLNYIKSKENMDVERVYLYRAMHPIDNDLCQMSKTSKYIVNISTVVARANLEQIDLSTRTDCVDLVNLNIRDLDKLRDKISITCVKGKQVKSMMSFSKSSTDVTTFKFGDDCLAEYIRMCCTDDNPVPNIVHYNMYNLDKLSFEAYISIVSVIRFVRPCVILIHGPHLPSGKYWSIILHLFANIIHVKRDIPLQIFGQQIRYPEHYGDVMRLESLVKYGGIYMDLDTIILRSIEDLRKFECVVSLQNPNYTIGSAFIMSKPGSFFVQRWLDGYKNNYKVNAYMYNAMRYPLELSKNYSNSVRVELGTISRPFTCFGFLPFIKHCRGNFWPNIYGFHMCPRRYYNIYKNVTRLNETNIRTMKTTIGAVVRYVLYGTKLECNS